MFDWKNCVDIDEIANLVQDRRPFCNLSSKKFRTLLTVLDVSFYFAAIKYLANNSAKVEPLGMSANLELSVSRVKKGSANGCI